jgi:hypothetical protein
MLELVCEHCFVEPEPARKADFDAIVACLPMFWGERDPVELHHPMFIHEFGAGALVIRDEQSEVAAYLFGFFQPERRLAYVHIIAVREDWRGRGLLARCTKASGASRWSAAASRSRQLLGRRMPRRSLFTAIWGWRRSRCRITRGLDGHGSCSAQG